MEDVVGDTLKVSETLGDTLGDCLKRSIHSDIQSYMNLTSDVLHEFIVVCLLYHEQYWKEDAYNYLPSTTSSTTY